MTSRFDTLYDRRSTESVKWNLFPEDVLPMWVADMDFAVPPAVQDALQMRVAHPIFGYPRVEPRLVNVIQNYLQAKYDWSVEKDWIIFLPGVVIAFNLAAQALSKPGGSVVFMTPVYKPFFGVAKKAAIEQISVDLIYHRDRYEVDWDKFEQAIAGRPSLFLLCNPHNPVGRVFERGELLRMAEICRRYDVPIVSDEIHSDLVFSGHTHIPIATLSADSAANTITLMAPSKTFNIPGLGCSFAIIPNPAHRAALNRARRGLVHGANLFGVVAAQAAYEQSQDWLNELLVYLEGNRDFLVEYIHRNLTKARVPVAEGTYLAWIDLRAYNLAPTPCEFLINNAGIGLNNGAEFGEAGNGFVRLNFGCPRSTLVEGLERIQRALEHLQ